MCDLYPFRRVDGRNCWDSWQESEERSVGTSGMLGKYPVGRCCFFSPCLMPVKIGAFSSGYLTPSPGDGEWKRRVQNLRLCGDLPGIDLIQSDRV